MNIVIRLTILARQRGHWLRPFAFMSSMHFAQVLACLQGNVNIVEVRGSMQTAQLGFEVSAKTEAAFPVYAEFVFKDDLEAT